MDFPPTLHRFPEKVMAKASHFRGRRDSEMVVRLHLIGPDFVFSRPEKGTGKVKVGCPVVA